MPKNSKRDWEKITDGVSEKIPAGIPGRITAGISGGVLKINPAGISGENLEKFSRYIMREILSEIPR